MKFICMLVCVIAIVVSLSNVDGATSRLKVKTSPLGRHSHTHEHHVGKVKSCAGSMVGAARFGAIRLGRSSTCSGVSRARVRSSSCAGSL